MARDLDQLEELTRGFISNVSHEFKTPMTTIGGFVDGMIDGTIPLDQRDKYLKIIAEETKRLSRMVNRMLDAAKIQSGELILSPAPFDFTEMTAQILLSFEQKIEKKKLDVQCDLEERLTVMGDRDHLYRVVYNLTDNAVKFIEDGGTLRLKVHQEGQLCVFAISNTGIGISAEDLPHVFDRFYKTDRSRSMDKTGAGLGLYIVKNIINLHGGEISVRSGGGETEFAFTLQLPPEQNRQNNTLFPNSHRTKWSVGVFANCVPATRNLDIVFKKYSYCFQQTATLRHYDRNINRGNGMFPRITTGGQYHGRLQHEQQNTAEQQRSE